MLPTMIIGIDPGLTGAAVRLAASGRLAGYLDFGAYRDPEGPGLDARALCEAIRPLLSQGVSLIIIERPAARPMSHGQGVASAFNFGHSCGLILGLCAALAPAARIIHPHPAIWKAAMGVPADKAKCTARAAELFPDTEFYGPRGGCLDGRAEAALLAYFGTRFLPPVKKISRLI